MPGNHFVRFEFLVVACYRRNFEFTIQHPLHMKFEENYKLASDIADMFVNEEESLAQISAKAGTNTIFSDDHPLYAFLSFPYPNLFTKSGREKYIDISRNEIRGQHMIRIRNKCMTIISLTGIEFVNELTKNIIDGIVKTSRDKKPRALRRELEAFFFDHPELWFCVIGSSIFNNKFISYAVKHRSTKPVQKLDIEQTIRSTSVKS